MLLAWAITSIALFYAGYKYREIVEVVKYLEGKTKERLIKQKEEEVKSVILDPYDAVQVAKYEHDRKVKDLNPGIRDEDL